MRHFLNIGNGVIPADNIQYVIANDPTYGKRRVWYEACPLIYRLTVYYFDGSSVTMDTTTAEARQMALARIKAHLLPDIAEQLSGGDQS